jgi:short subunit dehydrogenase-like uncharacterized protein
MTADWLLYGAYGYTGELIAEEAVRRGHRPLLAGRSARKLKPLADRLGLAYAAVPLDDPTALARLVGQGRVVMHAAGPYIATAAPMLAACLAGQPGTHYLDLTGELDVLARHLSPEVDAQARQRGIAVISGAGFDVVPSDCLALHVAQQVPGAVRLDVAIAALGGISAGTLKSGLMHLDDFTAGYLVRRAGQLQPGHGVPARRVALKPGGPPRTVRPYTWGDLVTAYSTTGIPNITTYFAMPASMVRARRVAGWLLRPPLLNKVARAIVGRAVKGPSPAVRARARSRLWARAEDGQGRAVEARLVTPEAYALTALVAVRAVERLLAPEAPVGALTPAKAFGANFVLSVPGVELFPG